MHIFRTPFLFLSIKFPGKWMIMFIVPMILTVVFVVLVALSDTWLRVYNNNQMDAGIIDEIIQILSFLSAFFLAALAAIATFQKDSLDKLISGDVPTLKHVNYIKEPEKLTRRRFLSFLFGYLFASSLLVMLYLMLLPIIGVILTPINTSLGGAGYYVAFTFSVYVILHIFCVSFLGVHYLAERINRPEIERK